MIEIRDIVIPLVLTLFSFLIWNLKRTIDNRDKRLEEGDKRMGRIEQDVHEIKENLPKEYVSKEDYKTDIKEIKSSVGRIEKYILEKRS